MNILERKAWLNARQNILWFLNKDPPSTDIVEYLNNLTKPPIRYYLPDFVIKYIYDISCDTKLLNAPIKRFQIQNDILEPYGFRPLSSGTNRRAFYCVYDPWIILKIASDSIGRSDNLSEFGIQEGLLPFCTKVFDVDPTGAIQLTERVEVMTEEDFRVYQDDICKFLESWFQLGYIFEDVGFKSFKNWGIRDGSGPVLLDFPYIYQLDPDKLICDRIDPHTHEKCGGRIGYNYELVMSEFICYKCRVRYSAQHLAKKIDGNSDIILGRKRKMRTPTKINVVLTRGNKVVYDPNAPVQPNPQQINVVPAQQPQPQYQTQIPWPQQSLPVQQQTQQVVSSTPPISQQIMPQNLNDQMLKSYAEQFYARALNSENPYISQQQIQQPTVQGYITITPSQQTTVTIDTVKDYEIYNKDGKSFIFYPKPLKNDIIQWLRKIEVNHGTEAAMFIAQHLLIEYIPKAQWDNTKKQAEPIVQQITPPVQQVLPRQPVIAQQSMYQTVNPMVNHSPVETIIAPQTKPPKLKVEDPNHWNNIRNNISPTNTQTQQVEQRPTTGLEIMKPMTQEEIEAQELKNRGETGMMGFAGVPMIDTMKMKEALPKIKAIVEQKFNGFELNTDPDLQEFQLAQDITRFIAEDIQNLMHNDGKGLLVTAKRTMDNHNNDCFFIRVLDYGSILFTTVLYPAKKAEPVQPQVTPPPVQQQEVINEDTMNIPEKELIEFFEETVKKFDPSRCANASDAKKTLISFLYTALSNTYKGQITVPRAVKEATAYVNAAVKFNEIKGTVDTSNSKTTTTITRKNTVANAL